MGTVIYGSEIAKMIKEDVKQKIELLKQQNARIPHLVVILVGEHPASLSYVRGKEKASAEVGIDYTLLKLSEAISEEELLEIIKQKNEDDAVDGILVQLPLPKQLDEGNIIHAIDPRKDVDGFHPVNIGKMMLQEDTLLPCTPKGIMKMLEVIGYDDLSGKRAIIIGRSNIVGKPVAQLLLNKNATITVTHSKTKNIEALSKEHDIVIAAIGKPRFIHKGWIKKDAVVIDVGVNRDENNKLCGDVDFDDVVDHVSYITPVPKGVGPMTIAMLLSNTLEAYEKRR